MAENFRLFLYGTAATDKRQIDDVLKFRSDARTLAEKHLGAKSVAATMVTGLSALMNYERGEISINKIALPLVSSHWAATSIPRDYSAPFFP